MPYTHGHAVVNTAFLDWLLMKPENSWNGRFWLAVIVGGVLPDLPLLFFMLIEIPQHGASETFDVLYEEMLWQDIFGYAHSIPLSLLATLSMALVYRFSAVNPKEEPAIKAQKFPFLVRGKPDENEENRNDDVELTINPDDGSSDRRNVSVRGDSASTKTKELWILVFFFVFCSMLLHAFADIWLHSDDAHSQLLPFSRVKLHSPISYYNVAEFAWIWQPVEAALVWWSCRYMLKGHKLKRWFRWLLYGVAASYVVILIGTLLGAVLQVV